MGQRQRLTFAEKYGILIKCKLMGITGGRENIRKVSEWAVTEFNLKSPPSYITVLRILRDEAEITEWINTDGYVRKKKWSNRSNVFDEQLALWVWKMWERGVYLNEAIIAEKAKQLQRSLNRAVPPCERTSITFSNG